MQLIEADYLPQTPCGLFEGPWLVFAPHPDDETFGMGGAIALARRQGISVHIVVMTDGALGGVPSSEDIINTREKEAWLAATVLGDATIEFWSAPDRGLLPSMAMVTRVLTVMAQRAPATVFFPCPLEPHPDHRATACIVWEALRQWHFSAVPVSYDISAYGPCNRLLDITPVLGIKEWAMKAYTSQLVERPYLDRVLAHNRSRTWSLPATVTHAESFFVFAAQDVALAAMMNHVLSYYCLGLYTVAQAGEAGVAAEVPPQALRMEIGHLNGELVALRHSRSWRMTAPLRRLSRLFRRR